MICLPNLMHALTCPLLWWLYDEVMPGLCSAACKIVLNQSDTIFVPESDPLSLVFQIL